MALTWLDISHAPRDGTFILLAGLSGYSTTPLRVEVGHWSAARQEWITHDNSPFTDGGAEPRYWLPLPKTGGTVPPFPCRSTSASPS